jgi:translation initiation factor 5A
MSDDGDTKDDVRMPDGEIGEKINKLFKVEEKDTSKNHENSTISWRKC